MQIPAFINAKGKKIKGPQGKCYGTFIGSNMRLFLIYLDGSHYIKWVLSDAVLSWSLLRHRVLMIF